MTFYFEIMSPPLHLVVEGFYLIIFTPIVLNLLNDVGSIF